jgi:signal transduction histidine kinase
MTRVLEVAKAGAEGSKLYSLPGFADNCGTVGIRSKKAMRKLYLTCALTSLILTAAVPMSGAARAQMVLVIFSNNRSQPANRQIDDELRDTLGINTNLELTYQAEFLDYPRYGDEPDEAYDTLISDFLRTKYADQPIDVIVAAGPAAFRFLRRHQEDLFAGIPVLVIAISRTSYEDQPLPARFLIIPIAIDPQPTLEMAARLQPKAGEMIVITGASSFDLAWEKRIRSALTNWQAHPPVRYLSRMPLGDVLSQLSRLQQNSIVYSPGIQRDGRGKTYENRDVVRRMAEASSAPVYASYSTMINFGIVGGYVFDMADLGRQAGRVVKRILAGEKLTQQDMPGPAPSHYVVDWNQLERWHLPEANLPPGTIIVNREPGPWQKYKDYILGAVLLLLLQSSLILYLLAERRRRRLAQEQVAERLRFETLVAQVSSEFANLESGRTNQAILRSLQSVQEFFQSSLASIWRYQDAGSKFRRTYLWPEHAAGRTDAISPDDFPGTVRQLSRGESVRFSGDDELSKLEDCAAFRKAGIRSFLALPIQSENRLLGALALKNFAGAIAWPTGILPRLSTIVEILGGALARQYAAEALRESEVLKGVIFEYMQSNIAVIDNAGTVLEVNQQWIDSAQRDGASPQYSVGVGVNYLEVCRKAIGSEGAVESLRGIQSVLSGTRQTFEMEYACHSPSEQRWFRMTAMRLPRASGGALIIHFDITRQKLAELERERMQEETAQLHRVTEMGQLVASLAHELAQPLGAVLGNAQAAARLAARPEPDLAEIQSALADIIEDDQRARAVLNNVRAILKKHAVTPHRVNLNEIVENVTFMVRSSAQLRGIQLRSLLSEDAVMVQGDEVPLQQVLLNLVNNAMDAMSHVPAERRVLMLKTVVQSQNGSGLLIVEDHGPGVPDDLKAKLFEPFFTTKGEGLGMGLAICHTILQTLGGSIELQTHPEPGATFKVMLPLAA